MNGADTQNNDRPQADTFFICELCGVDISEDECEVTEDGEVYCPNCYHGLWEEDDF